jgi:hypothetical protein
MLVADEVVGVLSVEDIFFFEVIVFHYEREVD